MKMRHAYAGSSQSAIEKYIDGKISSSDYFREVQQETVREVQRDLEKPAPKSDKKD